MVPRSLGDHGGRLTARHMRSSSEAVAHRKCASAAKLVLETKGKHLEGSADTEFKDNFFKLLEAAYTQGVEAGEVDLFSERPDEMRFRILIQEEAWKADLETAL